MAEEELRDFLIREHAPHGFADRVFARTTRQERFLVGSRDARNKSSLVWSLATVILISAAGSASWHQHEQRVEGQRAAQDVRLALRITAAKVQIAQNRLRSEHRP